MAWVAVGAGVVGYALGGGGGGGGSAPGTDPLVGQAAMKNADLAKESLNWYKETYANDIKPRQEAMDKLNTQVTEDYLDTSKINKDRSSQQWDRFVSTFQPVEDQTVSDAVGYDSPEAMAAAAGEAATGVQSQFDNAGGQRRRALAATGVNPNSGRAMSMEQDAQLQLAATKAGAANVARRGIKDKAIALRTGVANFGRNMPNTAGISLNSSMGANGGAISANGTTNSMALNGINTMGNGFNTAISGNNSAGSLALGGSQAQLGAWGAQQQADATSSAGLGQLAGTALAVY